VLTGPIMVIIFSKYVEIVSIYCRTIFSIAHNHGNTCALLFQRPLRLEGLGIVLNIMQLNSCQISNIQYKGIQRHVTCQI
jgi:hypothetical protein